MSDATTAAPAASPAPDATAAPAAAPAPAAAAPAVEASAAPAASPAAAPAAAAEPKADDKPAGAPEAYADFTLPEGVQLDATAMGEFGALAKELNLSQEAAQKLVDLQAKATANTSQQMQAAIEAQGEKWAADAKADKEYGGDKFDANLAVGKAALEKFATPEFRSFLEQTKLGNHPEMLRFAYRVGQAISEDGFVPGRQGGAVRDARSMYSASNMNP